MKNVMYKVSSQKKNVYMILVNNDSTQLFSDVVIIVKIFENEPKDIVKIDDYIRLFYCHTNIR
jgi:hypothetical protein